MRERVTTLKRFQHPENLTYHVLSFDSFPGGSNENLLHKFNNIHKDSPFYEKPQRKENAFIIKHYAGKVKYQVSLV